MSLVVSNPGASNAAFRLDETGALELRTALRDAQAGLQRALDAHFASEGLTGVQAAVLDALHRHPGANLADICAILQIDAPALSRHVARLEAKGLCLRFRPRGDRRSIRVELLPAGLALAAEYPIAVAHVTERAFSGFDDAERDLFVRALRRMLHAPALND